MSLLNQTAVIVEDELHARLRLRQLLKAHLHIEIVAEAANGEQGLAMIKEHKPDLVFLDIQMPLLNGFEILKQLNYSPKIIFTTAYEEFALKAFEHNSIDYLLKPFSAERLQKAIQKLEKLSQGLDMQQLEKIMSHIQQEKKSGSITVTQGNKIIIIPYSDIIFLKATEKCIEIHDTKNRNCLIYNSLQKLIEEKLPDHFLQVHRAYIINKNYIQSIKKSLRGQLVFEMNDVQQTSITTGKTYVKEVREALAKE